MSPYHTVLFDLDGTLADTAPDMAAALNALRAERNLAPLPFTVIRPEVSHGSPALLKLGFEIAPDAPSFPALRQRFLDLYRDRLCVETRLFAGVPEVLDALEEQQLAWGIVTNKPGWLTDPLLAALSLTERAACVVSGDTTPNRKPHPASLLHACRMTDSTADRCVYVGDAERDVQAAHAAGMATVVARYGYIGGHERPETWNADAIIETPTQLLNWLRQAGVRAAGRPA